MKEGASMGAKHRRKCTTFVCKMLLKNICCADCKQKENCRYACENSPEKCGLLVNKKNKGVYKNE